MSKPAAPAAPSKDSEPILGIKVSWEIKLLCIVTVFSILKALKAITSHFLFLLFGRLFFIAGHAYFIYVFFFTNYRITKSTSRTTEEKNVARTQCQGVMKGEYSITLYTALLIETSSILNVYFLLFYCVVNVA